MQSVQRTARTQSESWNWKAFLGKLSNLHGRTAFLLAQPPNFSVLDVGCGNESPVAFKGIRPDCTYIGIDIEGSEVTPQEKQAADKLIFIAPDSFVAAFDQVGSKVNCVVSAHNLEHCLQQREVVRAMCNALSPNGRLYLAFPSEASVNFPSRDGSLNFRDDPTHVNPPPFDAILTWLRDDGCEIEFSARRHRPLPRFLIGVLLEPVSAIRKRSARFGGSWALYGFESVIWAKRVK